MSYIEARNAYFVDLLGSEICCLDQNSLKLITLAKIRNEDEALKNMYKGISKLFQFFLLQKIDTITNKLQVKEEET